MLSVFLAGAVLAAAQNAAPEPPSWEGRIISVRGDVTLYEAHGDAQGVPAAAEMPLEEGDRIATGADGAAEIGLEGQHFISLRPRSQFTLTSLGKSRSELRLEFGGLLARIQTLVGAQALAVRTPTAVAAVRGTELGVEVAGDETRETTVGVFDEGKVEVRGQSGAPEIVRNNQETVIRRGEAPAQAYILRRLARHRSTMRALTRRAAQLRRDWKTLPPDQRRSLRRELIKRQLEKRRQALERRRTHEMRRPAEERPDQKRMRKRKEEIRRQLGR